MRIFTFISGIFIIFLSNLVKVNALTPTISSPSATPTSVNQVDKDIQRIREAVQQKVIEKLKNITSQDPSQAKKGYLGKITTLEPTKLTLDLKDSTPLILQVTPNTTIIDSNRNKTIVDKLKIGQTVLAMGYLQADSSLDTKRIVVVDPKTFNPPPIIAIGKVVDVSQSTSVFSLIPFNNKNQQFQISQTKTSRLYQNGEKVDSSKLKAGQKVATILKSDPKSTKNYLALKIYILD